MTLRQFCTTLLLLLAAGCSSRPELLPPADQLRADVYWLADDARGGRLPGTPGNDAAARYIADRFAELGLKPTPGAREFRLPFETAGERRIGNATFLTIGNRRLIIDQDYRPLGFSASGTFDGDVAFVGFGVVNKDKGYDDYADIDVRGRVVLMMRYEPRNAAGKSAFTGGEWSSAATFDSKARAARAAGAAALLIVAPPAPPATRPSTQPEGRSSLIPFTGGSPYSATALPTFSITPETADLLLGDRSLTELAARIETTLKPQSVYLAAHVKGQAHLHSEPIRTANVAAVLPGTGPTREEYVVIGAHYDHIGTGTFGTLAASTGQIHNGADDNASGTAALLSLAQRLKTQPLKRSVMFVAFSAEESGLIGSTEFVKKLPVPKEKIAAMLNLDMVGRVRNDTLFVGGAGTRAAFRPILGRADAASPLVLKSTGEGGFGPSDHQPFAMAKVPVLFFFSGAHPQYHHPDDDAPLINYAGLDQVCRLAMDVLRQLDAEPIEPYESKFDAHHSFTAAPTTRPTTQSTQPAAQAGNASLGVVPDYGTELSTGGVRIGGARPGSAAERAGLREGDVLVGFNDQPIVNLHDLSDHLRQASPGDEVEIAYTRGGQRNVVRVILTERKGIQ